MTKNRGYILAREAAANSDYTRCRVGAIAIYHNKLLAVGWNSHKTSSLQARYNKERGFDGYAANSKIHAEMMVINKIRYLDIDFSQIRLFVWRGDSLPQLSRPCAACEKALRDLGVKRVFYTGNNSYISEIYK